MKLDPEIINTLLLAGEKGLKLEHIARNVFNASNSMFSPLDYKEVYTRVAQCLAYAVKKKNPIIQKGEGYAVYRLDFKSKIVKKMMLKFAAEEKEKPENAPKTTLEDQSLTLF
jgi:hypothetical protein